MLHVVPQSMSRRIENTRPVYDRRHREKEARIAANFISVLCPPSRFCYRIVARVTAASHAPPIPPYALQPSRPGSLWALGSKSRCAGLSCLPSTFRVCVCVVVVVVVTERPPVPRTVFAAPRRGPARLAVPERSGAGKPPPCRPLDRHVSVMCVALRADECSAAPLSMISRSRSTSLSTPPLSLRERALHASQHSRHPRTLASMSPMVVPGATLSSGPPALDADEAMFYHSSDMFLSPEVGLQVVQMCGSGCG